MLTMPEILALPVKNITAENAILFLWWASSQPEEALKIVNAWGFTVKNMNGFVWIKKTEKEDKDVYGMGHWTRPSTEHCLIATKGRPIRLDNGVRALFQDLSVLPGRKPHIMHGYIRRLLGEQARCMELFAKYPVENWDSWGPELDPNQSIKPDLFGNATR
jgi:N6-adenosine-specific RNA methylase IME4